MKLLQFLRLNALKILALGGLAAYFAFVVLSGRWAFYIDPRFQWLSIVAIILFSILALTHILNGDTDDDELYAAEDDHERVTFWPVAIAIVPLFLGLVIPAKPLGADALRTRGIDTSFNSVSLSASNESLTIIPSERNILDWARAIASRDDETTFNGENANVLGFVYFDERFAENQFMITRFTLSCCVADALAVGLVVQLPEGIERHELDTWLQIEGTFQETLFDGNIIPMLMVEDVSEVEQPAQPYLYQ